MSEILLINPRGRDRKGRFLKRASRYLKRAKRRILASNVASNPRRAKKTHVKSRRTPAVGYTTGTAPIRRRKLNPRRRKVRAHRRRANPRLLDNFAPKALLSYALPAGIGALGALGLDIALANLPLPATLQEPLWKNAVKIAGALGLGFAAGFVVSKDKARAVTVGALTVTGYGIAKEFVAKQFPQLLDGASTYDYSDLTVSGMGFVNPAPMLGAYMNDSSIMPTGVGAYMRGSLDPVNSLSGVVADGL